jgi:hypothetical protein
VANTTPPASGSSAIAAASLGLGLVWGAACFQADPSQVQVSPNKLGDRDPAGVVSPPKRTVSPLAESYDMAAPDRAPGPVNVVCRQPAPVHNQVSSRTTGVAAAVVDAVAEEGGAEVGVVEGPVDEPVDEPADEPVAEPVEGSAAASPVPPKRTSCDPS